MKMTKLTAALIAAAASGLVAQQVTGNLVGTVRDRNGNPVAAARIIVNSNQLAGPRTVQTGPDGSFRIPVLPPGTYAMTVERSGFITGRINAMVRAGSVDRYDVNLAAATADASAVVEVVAADAQVDKSQTTTQTSFTIDSLQDLPVGLNAFGALTMSPGITGSTTYASIRGGGQGQAQYAVNGISVRDNVTMQGRQNEVVLDDLIQDIQVVQSPLNARYGDTSSGFVNVVTKSGGNEWTGSLRVKLARDSWSARRPGTLNREGVYFTPEPGGGDQLRRTYEVTVTGPIIKDHLTFTYGSRIQPSSDSSFQNPSLQGWYALDRNAAGGFRPLHIYAGDGAIFPGFDKEKYNEFKTTWTINQSNFVDFGYTENISSYWANNNAFGPDETMDHRQTSITKFYTVNYRGIIGNNQVIEAKFGHKKTNIKFESGPGDPINFWAASGAYPANPLFTYYFDGNNITVNGAGADSQAERRENQTISLNYNLVFRLLGDHSLDVGYERHQTIWGTVQNSGGPNGRVFWNFGAVSGPGGALGGFMVQHYLAGPSASQRYLYGEGFPGTTAMIQFLGREQSEVKKPTDSLYVNDLWTINQNWSVMAGLRYQTFKLNDPRGTLYDSSALSPRFELKYDLNGDGRRLVNLTYAQFRGNVGERITRSYTATRRGARVIRLWTGTASGVANAPAALEQLATQAQVLDPGNYMFVDRISDPEQNYAIDPGFKPDVNHEITLGYRRAFDRGGYLRLTLVRRDWKDLPYSEGDASIFTVQDPSGVSAGVPGYMHTLRNDPRGKRNYQGLELEFSAPLGKFLTLSANYTFSKLQANNVYGDFTGFAGTETLANRGTFYSAYDAAGLDEVYYMPLGELPTSANHVAKAWLAYRYTQGKVESTVTLLGRYTSGGHESIGHAVNTAFIGASPLPQSLPILLNGRGRYTGADFYAFDLQFNMKFPVGKLQGFTALSINNVFNHIMQTSYNRGAASQTYTVAQLPTADFRLANANRWMLPNGQYGYPDNSSYLGYSGARSVTFDFGIRF